MKNLEKPKVFKGFLRIWGPEWKPNQRKSDQDGHVESKLGCLGRSWLQVGLSWEMLGARWSAMERLGAPRGATRGSQTGSMHPHCMVIVVSLGPYTSRGIPTILRLLLLANKLTTSSDSKTSKLLKDSFDSKIQLRSSFDSLILKFSLRAWWP